MLSAHLCIFLRSQLNVPWKRLVCGHIRTCVFPNKRSRQCQRACKLKGCARGPNTLKQLLGSCGGQVRIHFRAAALQIVASVPQADTLAGGSQSPPHTTMVLCERSWRIRRAMSQWWSDPMVMCLEFGRKSTKPAQA